MEGALDEARKDLPHDLFDRMSRLALIKLQVYRERPQLYRFLVRCLSDPAVSAEWRRRQQQAADRAMEAFFKDVDTSRLRPGVSLEQALALITLLNEGLFPRLMARVLQSRDLGYSEMEELVQEWRSYMFLLRDGLYRQDT
ncbi:MAG: hypothetical protein DIU69_12325 [Bacillota bacterium]|nr:MAG: hypothetical protein DIU69_12325 [Bacillota bacterium]